VADQSLNHGLWYTCTAAWLRDKGVPWAGVANYDLDRRNRALLLFFGMWKQGKRLPGEDGRLISLLDSRPEIAFRYVNRELTCFYFPKGTFAKWFQDEPAGISEVYFTEPDPPYKRIEDLAIGQRFRIAVIFSADQEDSTEIMVTLTTEGGRDAKQFATTRTADRKVFRSRPIRLTSIRVQE
jgi:hypothetical protein